MFPRKSGKAAVHTVKIPFDNYESLTKEERNTGLSALEKRNAELIKGDFVSFESEEQISGLAIYDGYQLKNMEYIAEGTVVVPKYFHVIENNTPIDYWSVDNLDNGIVWFDHSMVRDQCVENIKYENSEFSECIGVLFTTFKFNGTEYVIVYDNIEHQSEIARKFSDRLSKSEGLLPFHRESDYGPYNNARNVHTTLFLKF